MQSGLSADTGPSASVRSAKFLTHHHARLWVPALAALGRDDNERKVLGPDDSSAPLLIPESGHYVKGVFRRAWEAYGGRASLGLPLSEAFVRPSDKHVIQFFEGAVLELDPSASGDPHTVPGADKLMRVLRPVDLGAQAAAGRGLLPSDGSVAGAFRDFYGRVSGEWRLGGPISAELTEEIGGVPTRVQYFQHGRLELNPATGQVVVGALGRLAWDAQCAAQK